MTTFCRKLRAGTRQTKSKANHFPRSDAEIFNCVINSANAQHYTIRFGGCRAPNGITLWAQGVEIVYSELPPGSSSVNGHFCSSHCGKLFATQSIPQLITTISLSGVDKFDHPLEQEAFNHRDTYSCNFPIYMFLTHLSHCPPLPDDTATSLTDE